MQPMQDIELEILQRFDDSRNAYNRASALLRAGREQEAETLLRQALAMYPREALMDPEGEMDRSIRDSFERLFTSIRLRLEEIEKRRNPLDLQGAGITNLQEIIERNLRNREMESGSRPAARRPGRREPLSPDWATAGVAAPEPPVVLPATPEPEFADTESVPQQRMIQELLKGAMDSLDTRPPPPEISIEPEPEMEQEAEPAPEPVHEPRPPQPAFFEEPFLEDIKLSGTEPPEVQPAAAGVDQIEEFPEAVQEIETEIPDDAVPEPELESEPFTVDAEDTVEQDIRIEEPGVDKSEIELILDEAATAEPQAEEPPRSPSEEEVDAQFLDSIGIESEPQPEIELTLDDEPEVDIDILASAEQPESAEPQAEDTQDLRTRLRDILGDAEETSGEPLQKGDMLEEVVIPEEDKDINLETDGTDGEIYVGEDAPARDEFEDLTPLRRPAEQPAAEIRPGSAESDEAGEPSTVSEDAVPEQAPVPDEYIQPINADPESTDREQSTQNVEEPSASPQGPAPALETGKGAGMGFFGKLKQKFSKGGKTGQPEVPVLESLDVELPAADTPAVQDTAPAAEEPAPAEAPEPADAPAPAAVPPEPEAHGDDDEGLEDDAVVAAMVKIEVKQPRTIGHMQVYDSRRTVRLLLNVVILALIGVAFAAAYVIVKPAVQLERVFAYAMPSGAMAASTGPVARAVDFLWETKTVDPKDKVEVHRNALSQLDIVMGDSEQGDALVASVAMADAVKLAEDGKYDVSIDLADWAIGSSKADSSAKIEFCDILGKGIKSALKNKEYKAAKQRASTLSKLLKNPEFPTPGKHASALFDARVLDFKTSLKSIMYSVNQGRARDAFFELLELAPIDDPALKEQAQDYIQQLNTKVREALLEQARIARDQKHDNATAEDLISKAKQLESAAAQ